MRMAEPSSLSYNAAAIGAPSSSEEAIPLVWLFGGPVIIGLAYYLGAWLGIALTLPSSPISTLWPPNSILFAALLLAPTRWWWWILLGCLPAHLASELPSGFPPVLVLGWYVSNCTEALVGALILRRVLKAPLRFDRSEHVGLFIGSAFLAVVTSGFLDAGFVTLAGASDRSYWQLWQSRLLSNLLTSFTVIPLVVSWARDGFADLRSGKPERYLEAALLTLGLLAVSILVFNDERSGGAASPALLYAPLPFVLWAAVRFGSRATSSALLIVAWYSVWGAVHGHGPFLTRSPAENAVAIQMFLIVFSVPLLVLAAVIQERRYAEAKVRQDQERLNLVLEAAQVGTWEWHIRSDAGSLSRRSQEILGIEANEGGQGLGGFLDAVSPDDRPRVEEAIRDAVDHRVAYESEFRVKGPGAERWVLGKGKAAYDDSGHPIRMLGVNVDITDRKTSDSLRQEEALLRESEAKLRELANAMPQIVWTATAEGRLDYFNGRWYDLTGASPDTVAEASWLTMTHPADREKTVQAWQRAVSSGEPCEVEHRLRVIKSGEYRWHLARALPVRDATGAIVRWYGSCTDIQDQKHVEEELWVIKQKLEERVDERTAELVSAVEALETEISDRVAAERALRSSEQRFSKAFQASPDAILILRQADFRIIEVNQRWESMFGYSRAEAVGHTADDLRLIVNEEERQQARSQLKVRGFVAEFEISLRTKSGDVLRALLVGESLEMGGEPCYIAILRDITERKRAESIFREQQRELAHLGRVAALGELSGTLAHELNQPLAAILTNVNAARRLLTADPPDLGELRAILEDIAADDRRAGEVISRLRGMLRKGELQLRTVNLEEVIDDVRGLLHSDLIQRRVSVSSHVEPGLPPVLGDPIQLEQVLLNLMLNACDAMAGNSPEERAITLSARLGNGAVLLSVKDQGSGIPETRLDEVFQPFVTTKENGLGLGLAICRSIISAHGGWMWAVNNEEAGATFVVQLPVASGREIEPSAAADRLEEERLSRTGNG
jgi:PAS domain S-box-containing protein